MPQCRSAKLPLVPPSARECDSDGRGPLPRAAPARLRSELLELVLEPAARRGGGETEPRLPQSKGAGALETWGVCIKDWKRTTVRSSGGRVCVGEGGVRVREGRVCVRDGWVVVEEDGRAVTRSDEEDALRQRRGLALRGGSVYVRKCVFVLG